MLVIYQSVADTPDGLDHPGGITQFLAHGTDVNINVSIDNHDTQTNHAVQELHTSKGPARL